MDCHRERGFTKETLRGTKGSGQVSHRAHWWDKDWRYGGENNPRAGTDETFRYFIVARETSSALGTWYQAHRVVGDATLDTCTNLTTSRVEVRSTRMFELKIRPITAIWATVPAVPTSLCCHQASSRNWTCLHRQSTREAKARRWTFGA